MNYRRGAGIDITKKEGRSFFRSWHQQRPRDYSIIVHSHLDWDWVWQRPQQFLSRLSKRHRVLFVEAPRPIAEISSASVCVRDVADYPNILVVQNKIPATCWSDGAWVDQERRRLLQTLLAEPVGRNFASPVQWFYDPMAVTAFAGHLNERAIVYDCMDELSSFRGSPPEMVRRDRELLAVADVVFAGGPKICRAKRELNANCFSFGCGVDAKHFSRARDPKLLLPADVRDLPHPIYGYIGVVDERIDYDLLAALADASNGSVVMVGPSTKVDPATFPRRANLHWLGGRDYAELPAYAKSFEVCLMPFALNKATEFINPTKALEYMGTGKPIISTSVEDVVMQFSEVVVIAESHADFIAKAARYSLWPDQTRIKRGFELVRRNSWESIVGQLEKHVADTLASKRALAVDAA
jgi:glycosyltransferase involved in cell wall biosynthesis